MIKVICLLLLFIPCCLYGQNNAGLYSDGKMRSSDEGFASQEFRRGVQTFYRGSYNEAILQFEKALSYLPEDAFILDWLGRAYYYTGIEGTALEAWERAEETGYGGLLLHNKIEIIRERRVVPEKTLNEAKYTEAGSFSGIYKGNQIFSSPVSVLTNPNGTMWVLSYGSNELLLFNVNGSVINRVTGPVNGFDHPKDIIRLKNGNLLVSETLGDRLSLLDPKGKFIKYIGSKGYKKGELLGPEYLAEDFHENIFVTDYGNKRVDVFDKNGESLFYFGTRSQFFSGLMGPTGIAISGSRVFVADDQKGCIYEFDVSGNYKRALTQEDTFKKIESIKFLNNYLMVCDSDKVYSVDIEMGSLTENVSTGSLSHLTSCMKDANGNLVVTDIKNNEVYVMSQMEELVGGLFVQIEKINAESFPFVNFDVKVENRHRRSIVGLKENNFFITENKRPVTSLKYIGSSNDNEVIDITLLLDRSLFLKEVAEDGTLDNLMRELSSLVDPEAVLRIVSCSEFPAVEYKGAPSKASLFKAKALKTPVSSKLSLDLALRLCGNDLINERKKRAVIYITSGKVTDHSFDKYSLSDMANFYNNNNISLACINLGPEVSSEIQYLVSSTGGKLYDYGSEEGYGNIIKELKEVGTGVYSFSYISSLMTEFGQKYLPLEVETYLLNSSGRDETGYFAPLE